MIIGVLLLILQACEGERERKRERERVGVEFVDNQINLWCFFHLHNFIVKSQLSFIL